MGCGSCSTGACSSTPAGCNGNGGCATGGCNKLNTFDWFGAMQQPSQHEHENIYEVRFKNSRKAFFRNVNGLSLITGDMVVVESDRGFDLGQISLGGILAKLQMKKRRVNPQSDKVRKIYRRAGEDDVEKLKKARSRERETLIRTRVIIRSLNLDMKASDVEYQGDNTKAIFYYIADQRVDFRELIRLLANEFRIRVEMKQIGLRHESGLVGGIGSCGRELCCSTWLTDFKSVSTSAARYQNLSLNPMKISGQCGRLKCCLNFELDTYMDALREIPKADRIETEAGMAFLQKTDIFKRTMWFSYAHETTWVDLSVDLVVEMLAMNAEGKKPVSLRSLDGSVVVEDAPVDFVDVVGQATLREEPKRRKKRKGKRGQGQGQSRNRSNSQRGKGGGRENQNQKAQNKRGSGRNSNRTGNTSDPRGKNESQNSGNQRKPQNRNARNKQGGNNSGKSGGGRGGNREGGNGGAEKGPGTDN